MDTPKMETIELSCATGTDSQHKAASDKHDREANSTGELLASHSCDECQEQELNKPDLVNVFWRVKQVDRSKLMIPPLNFAMVNKGVYRSGYPNKRNFYFLKTLGLKSILYLSPEKHEELKIGRQNIQFIEENNLDLFHIGISGQKEPFQVTSETDFARALRVVLDKRNHPILIHCDKGKHRTGCMVACLRKEQGWSLAAAFDEYTRFCQGSSRILDLQFIELFTLPPST